MTKPIQPFLGFPPEGLRFLEELAEHNEKAWFEAHKKTYVKHLLRPVQAFIVALGERLQRIDPELQYDTRANGAGSLYRIYRDTRFLADKTPYKTHMDVAFWVGEKKNASPSILGVRIEPRGGMVLGGNYRFDNPLKAHFQEAAATAARGEALRKILENLSQQGYTIEGECYKRVPPGYDRDHPRADLLRYKSLYALSPDIPPETLTDPSLVEAALVHCQALAPLHHWLVRTAS
jgi:uncharacterized protein (TIGR02453 family)